MSTLDSFFSELGSQGKKRRKEESYYRARRYVIEYIPQLSFAIAVILLNFYISVPIFLSVIIGVSALISGFALKAAVAPYTKGLMEDVFADRGRVRELSNTEAEKSKYKEMHKHKYSPSYFVASLFKPLGKDGKKAYKKEMAVRFNRYKLELPASVAMAVPIFYFSVLSSSFAVVFGFAAAFIVARSVLKYAISAYAKGVTEDKYPRKIRAAQVAVTYVEDKTTYLERIFGKLGVRGKEEQQKEQNYRYRRYKYETPLQIFAVFYVSILAVEATIPVYALCIAAAAGLAFRSVAKYVLAPRSKAKTEHIYATHKKINTVDHIGDLGREGEHRSSIQDYMETGRDNKGPRMQAFREVLRKEQNIMDPVNPYQGMGIAYSLIPDQKLLKIDDIFAKDLKRFYTVPPEYIPRSGSSEGQDSFAPRSPVGRFSQGFKDVSRDNFGSENSDSVESKSEPYASRSQKREDGVSLVDANHLKGQYIESIEFQTPQGLTQYSIEYLCRSSFSFEQVDQKLVKFLRGEGDICFRIKGDDKKYLCQRDHRSVFIKDIHAEAEEGYKQFSPHIDGMLFFRREQGF